MKNKTKLMIVLAIACAGTLTLGACKSDNFYSQLIERDLNAIVRFEPNGGLFSGEEKLVITNVYKYDDLAGGQLLFRPDDTQKKGQSASFQITYTNHFFVGWFREATPKLDADGNQLDEYGEVWTEESGKQKGYDYADPWDFSQKATQDDFEKQKDGSYTLTLYAGWIPYFSYVVLNDQDEEIARSDFDPSTERGKEAMNLKIPEWNEETGAMDYGYFPTGTDKTFVSVRETKDSKENLTSIQHSGTWDPTNCTFQNPIKTYYGEYREGEWFRIKNAKQLETNYQANRCFEILEDLDFGELDANGYAVAKWPDSAAIGEFSGQIIGNGKTIKNISILNSNTSGSRGGLFGSISETATIKDINFENITYSLLQGTRTIGACFGLFAGEVRSGASISNVSIKGKLIIGNNNSDPFASQSQFHYNIGKITGNLNNNGITAEVEVEGQGGLTIKVEDDGSITATV